MAMLKKKCLFKFFLVFFWLCLISPLGGYFIVRDICYSSAFIHFKNINMRIDDDNDEVQKGEEETVSAPPFSLHYPARVGEEGYYVEVFI